LISRRRLAVALLCLGALSSLAAAQTAPKKYLAFGDSITFGVGDDPNRAKLGYPPRLENRLQTAGVSATAVPLGVSGEKTPEGLGRINSALTQAQAAPGDVLILMEGTNDVSQRDLISIENTIQNLDRMADAAQALSLTVIHATVIPRPPWAKKDADNLLTDQLNGRIRNLAGQRLRRLADPNEVFRATPNVFDSHYSHAGDDLVGHPNATGYDLMAGVFFNVIQGIDNVPPVPGVLLPENGASNVPPDRAINVQVCDFGAGIDLANTFLFVNGQQVSAVPTGTIKLAQFTYQPPAPLSGTVRLGLRSRDLAVPANTVDREIAHFTIRGTNQIQGDLNGDGRVDGTDLVLFGRHFGSQRGGSNWDENSDFNNDGKVDGSDLAVLASNFGRSSTTG
jgi:lysophospholipase L1-like esterase